MTYIYNAILDFLNVWFPNDLSIELLKLNELLSYILTLGLVFTLIKWLLKIVGLVKK